MPNVNFEKESESRTLALLGCEGMERLKKSKVMIFGLGGVGGHALDAIVRAGVSKVIIVDNDSFEISNLNRQMYADTDTIGAYKVDSVKQKLLKISPNICVETVNAFYTKENPVEIPNDVDCVIDGIDTVSAKLHIIKTCAEKKIAYIGCMGMGNRFDPSKIKIDDLFNTFGDPLCRVIRRQVRKINISNVCVVFSVEEAVHTIVNEQHSPGSLSYMPSTAGLYMCYKLVDSIAVKNNLSKLIPLFNKEDEK